MSDNWTTPYYGVQHRRGLPDGYQITITDYGTFTRGYVLWLRGPKPFSSTAEQLFDTPEEARVWGDNRAVALDGAK